MLARKLGTDTTNGTPPVALASLGDIAGTLSTSTTTSTSGTITVASGTQSLVVLVGVITNGSRFSKFSSVSFGGTACTKIVGQASSNIEYTFDTAVYALNSPAASGTLSVVLTGTNTTYYGIGYSLVYLNKQFSSFTADDTMLALNSSVNPLTGVLNNYAGGFSCGSGSLYTWNYFTPWAVVNNPFIDSLRYYAHGYTLPTTDATNVTVSMANCAAGNPNGYGYGMCGAAWAATKFV